MKKLKPIIAVGVAAAMLSAVGLAACKTVNEYELSAYTGGNKDADGNTTYNTALFYSNTVQQGYPDPQVMDDTAQTGYYYLYGTSGNFAAMRSKNLVEWENIGTTFPRALQGAEGEKVTWTHNWAPEAVYDSDTKLYYLFFSARPDLEDASWNSVDRTQNGVVDDRSGDDLPHYNMYVATSESPAGPFMLVDFTDEDKLGKDKVHSYNTTANIELTEEQVQSGEYAYVTKNGKYYQAAFPDVWAKYCLFSPDELSKVMQKNGIGIDGGSSIKTLDATYTPTIDPHPFVDPATGKKYMFFKSEDWGWNINIGVEMEDWLTPIWSTAKYITHSNFYTIEDWQNGENRGVSYELEYCNEGAFVLHHKDKSGNDLYYFTYSVNDYSKSDYQVGMAVSKNGPLGPYRKLTEAEGGLLLCSSTTDSNTVSGAGHHSFVTLGDQLFIAYHRHRDFLTGGPDRYTAVDEIKFITVEDKFGEEMEIPYVNGPTDSMQPLPEGYSGYKNVAGNATVTCTDADAEIKWATDGLLSVHKVANEDFMSYIGETYVTETATFTFEFAQNTSVRAVIVYNSAFENSIFLNISRMEFTLADGSVRVIRDVKFDTEQYCIMGGEFGDTVNYVKSGSAAFAEFYDVSVKSIKITVDVPENQESVGISEIKILGKA